MKRRLFSGLVLAVYALGTGGVLYAQTTVTQNATTATQMAIFHFSFRDSTRGTMVKPEAVLIDDKVIFNAIDEAGRMSVPVPPGDHQVVIKAAGYDDMDSRQTASLDTAPMNLIMLDPSSPPEELFPENLGEGMPAGGTIIAGYVIDEDMGKPLNGAEIQLIDKDVKVKTNERGFFKLPVEMPDGKPMPEDPSGSVFSTKNFRVTMPGYGFEERLNTLVQSGTPRIYQVEMIRGGGGNTLDESDGRNNLQSSLFGLRNVEPEDPLTSASMPSPSADAINAATDKATSAGLDLHGQSHDGHDHP